MLSHPSIHTHVQSSNKGPIQGSITCTLPWQPGCTSLHRKVSKGKAGLRLGVVMVGVNIDVPQAQLMQLADDLLHGIRLLVCGTI